MTCEGCNRLIADNKRLVEEREQLLSVLKDERNAIGLHVGRANRLEAKLQELRSVLLKAVNNYCE